jgi:gluconolactonase
MSAMAGNIVVSDERFGGLVPRDAAVETLFAEGTFTEGPVWFADARCLLFSDIPANRILRLTGDGDVSVFREPSNNTNGNTRDREGRLLSCEHSGRRVSRIEIDGTITTLADSFEGKPLNSPNDVVVRSDGSIWFTDPDYGVRGRADARREQKHENVFRLDPLTGVLTAVVSDFDKPNGLAFSHDESLLYVADSAVSDGPDRNSHLRRFRVNGNGTLSGGEVFVTTVGTPDGLRCDVHGNVWTSAGDKVEVYAPDATLLGAIRFPAIVTNLTFGGEARDRIYVTAGGSLFSVRVSVLGAQRP